MLIALRQKLSRMGVLLTLLLALFAAAPSLDAWACTADESSVATSVTVDQSGDETSKTNGAPQHRCYCAGHCCPAGVAVEGTQEFAYLVAGQTERMPLLVDAVVPRAPQALERPPRA